jgi:hypothetical protein
MLSNSINISSHHTERHDETHVDAGRSEERKEGGAEPWRL